MKKNYIKIVVTLLLALVSQLSSAQISETVAKPIGWPEVSPVVTDIDQHVAEFALPGLPNAAGNLIANNLTYFLSGITNRNFIVEVKDTSGKLLNTYTWNNNTIDDGLTLYHASPLDSTSNYIQWLYIEPQTSAERNLFYSNEGVLVYLTNLDTNITVGGDNALRGPSGKSLSFFWNGNYEQPGNPSVICIDGTCSGPPPAKYLENINTSTQSSKQLNTNCDGCNDWEIEVIPSCIGCIPGVYYGPLYFPPSTINIELPDVPFDLSELNTPVHSSYEQKIEYLKNTLGKWEVVFSENVRIEEFSKQLIENHIFENNNYRNIEHLHEVGLNKVLFMYEYYYPLFDVNFSDTLLNIEETTTLTLNHVNNLVLHPNTNEPIGIQTLTNTHGAFFEAKARFENYEDFDFDKLLNALRDQLEAISYSGFETYHNSGLVETTYELYYRDDLVLLDEYFKYGYKFDDLMNIDALVRYNILSNLTAQGFYISNDKLMTDAERIIDNEKIQLTFDLISDLAENGNSSLIELEREGFLQLMKAQLENFTYYKELGLSKEFANNVFLDKLDLFGLENLDQFNGYEDYVLDVFRLDDLILSDLNVYFSEGNNFDDLFETCEISSCGNIVSEQKLFGTNPPKKSNGGKLILVDGATVSSTFTGNEQLYIENSIGERVNVKVVAESAKTISYKNNIYTAVFNKESGAFVGYATNKGVFYKDAIIPSIISREQWGAAPTFGNNFGVVNDRVDYFDYIAIHHAGNDNSPSINSVQQSHLDQGWHDIGYHFAVDLQGNIYEGRSLDKRGAGAEQADLQEGIIHIVVLGDLQTDGIFEWSNSKLTNETINSLTKLSQYLSSKYNISYLGGHQEIFCNHTVCPGNLIMNKINEIGEKSSLNPANCVIYDNRNFIQKLFDF